MGIYEHMSIWAYEHTVTPGVTNVAVYHPPSDAHFSIFFSEKGIYNILYMHIWTNSSESLMFCFVTQSSGGIKI